mmetsp:Transcript_12684/g.29985  ORF Transcript_12684/g.29985 Transcript_12684/m.29985 type:complete len:528 (+) Transcript_12684:237-1820(+)
MSAFDRLMRRDSKKPSRSARTSQFFPCPAGCGRNVTERSVNDHLDICPKLACGRKMVHPSANDNQLSNDPDKSKRGRVDKAPGESNGSQPVIPDDSAPTKRRKVQDDAFAHMLKNASKVYSALEKHTTKFVFHLNEDLSVTWNSVTDDSKSDSTCWTELLSLKNLRVASSAKEIGSSSASEGKLPPNEVVELALTSSIPSASAALPRLVEKHSRLNPSHLKSCLQKSTRRRSGEQAVRVAMELIDRAYDQFIRRLPIIILEDSTLHPDFGLLVWLMIAESKGYVPSRQILNRLLEIVYEVASCPLKDFLNKDIDCSSDSFSLSLNLPSSALSPNEKPGEEEVVVRSMLLRAQYGGMSCDIDMMLRFARIWRNRFVDARSKPPTSLLCDQWQDVPQFIHEQARRDSHNVVASALSAGNISMLCVGDLCIEGIDFHCSSVVDFLLGRKGLPEAMKERLAGSHDSQWLKGQIKRLIWNHSSGVNHRKPLGGEEKSQRTTACDPTEDIWDDVLKPDFEKYCSNFILNRLAR